MPGFDASEAERGGYSNYSYWRATLRVFFKNRIAVFFLIVMILTLAFTFIQPLLPNQRDPLTIHYNESGRTLSNLAPAAVSRMPRCSARRRAARAALPDLFLSN